MNQIFYQYKVHNGEEDYNADAAALLKKDEEEIYDYVCDFLSDITFHFEKETFFEAI